MPNLLEILAPVGWGSLVAALGVALYVWISSRYVRTLVAKRHQFAESQTRGTQAAHNMDVSYTMFKQLKAQGVVDPDIDLFIAVFEDNVDLLKAALNEGANPNVSDTEVLRRHQTN